MEFQSSSQPQLVFEKLQRPSPERLQEVEDFIDFLKQREERHNLIHSAMITSEKSFAQIWGNPEDDVYDKL